MRFRIEQLEDRVVPARPLPLPFIFVGSGAGEQPVVKSYFAETGELAFEKTVFEGGFSGGVRVAAGDINHDGWPDLIAAAGAGGGPHVKIYDGKSGNLIDGPLGGFFAFDSGFSGGANVGTDTKAVPSFEPRQFFTAECSEDTREKH